MTDKVRAKFRVISITRHAQQVRQQDGSYKDGELQTVEMAPVYANGDPNHENSRFWAATPGGSIKLTMVHPEAVAAFKIGGEFYVDFTPAG